MPRLTDRRFAEDRVLQRRQVASQRGSRSNLGDAPARDQRKGSRCVVFADACRDLEIRDIDELVPDRRPALRNAIEHDPDAFVGDRQPTGQQCAHSHEVTQRQDVVRGDQDHHVGPHHRGDERVVHPGAHVEHEGVPSALRHCEQMIDFIQRRIDEAAQIRWLAEHGKVVGMRQRTSPNSRSVQLGTEDLRQLTHPKDHGPLQSPTLHRHLLPHGHRPRLSPLRPHLHRPPRRRPRRHGGTSPLCRNAARCPDDDALRHRHCASADSGGKGGEQYQRENAAVVLSGGECDYDCDGGLVCGGGVLDGLKFAYYVTKRIM